MTDEAIPALVFLPLLAATAAAVVPAMGGRVLALVTLLVLPLPLYWLIQPVLADGTVVYALAGFPVPLGIHLRVDGFSLLMLGLVWVVMLGATTHAALSINSNARRFWPPWLMLLAGLNTMLVSGDLFNIYVGLELVTIAAVALVAFGGTGDALRAAMRYLLLAILGSLVYLLGVAVTYASTGTVDLELAAERAPGGILATAPVILMAGGLMLKAAIFPLHGWLPAAHASAPGPVSAVLSALVVKASLYVLLRLWFEGQFVLPPALVGTLLAALGGSGVIFASVMALRQSRLKRVVAYSTVAQLGYVMLLFDLPAVAAWHGAVYQMLSHGLAKAAMFLAAANLMRRLGSDELKRLPGIEQRMPVTVFAFGLASVSLMGLPPSGGFLAKWQLLAAAWEQGAWHWVIVVLAGSLLAAAYLFRVIALMFSRPAWSGAKHKGAAPRNGTGMVALALAVLAILAGFAAAPVLELLPTPSLIVEGAP